MKENFDKQGSYTKKTEKYIETSNLKIILRKMSRKGDECSTVTFPEMQMQLHNYLGMHSVAVKADAGEMIFIGNEFPLVMDHINGLVQQEAERIEVLLIPRISGG